MPGSVRPPLTLNAWLRYDHVLRYLKKARDARTALEIGAGEGAFGTRLARRYAYTGVEMDGLSAARAKERLSRIGLGRIVETDALALDLGEKFDVICALEVLEHIEDDVAALASWCRLLAPGGSLVLSVPAYRHRYGAADSWVGHYRRYERAQLIELLEGSGLVDVQVVTYGFPLGFALEAVRNRLVSRKVSTNQSATDKNYAERSAGSGRLFQPSDHLGWLTWLAALPFRMAQIPFASSGLGTGFVARGRAI